jgi:hypothetical protein
MKTPDTTRNPLLPFQLDPEPATETLTAFGGLPLVAQVGELDAQGRARAKALAQALVGRVTQPDLFAPETAVEAVVPVHLDRVRLERGRRVGDVWRGWPLWRALRLDTALETLLSAGREAVPWLSAVMQ